jgi:hypothetical protein
MECQRLVDLLVEQLSLKQVRHHRETSIFGVGSAESGVVQPGR